MTVEFRADRTDSTIDVVDRIEGRRFPLSADRPVTLERGVADRFPEPVDAAASGRIERLDLPYVVAVYVRDADGEMVAECHDFASEAFPDGEYELEIAAPIKLFVLVSGAVTIGSSNVGMRISFGEETRVDLGARSYHERPAATVTATAAPEDLMAAVSTFGSALQTTSPERSFPSLRGHPPAIELGDALDVPAGIEPPDTGLRIEVPRERSAVYAVATLAHYLGARVRPGPDAALLADDEVVQPLDGTSGLHRPVTETLQRIFLLDCVVRTEGRYRLDLHERRRLDERVDLPLAELYDAPIAERVERYLSVPATPVLDLAPTWCLATHLSPAPCSATVLPHAANALSLVRVERRGRSGGEQAAPPRGGHQAAPPGGGHEASPPGYEEFAGSAEFPTDSPDTPADMRYVRLPETGTLERAWFGPGRSVNANDLLLEGIHNGVAETAEEGPIDIALVCNDERMAGELGDGALYGDREELPFSVTVHRERSREELRGLLRADLDFLHYVGHVDREGFVCQDGSLEADELDDVGVDTFLLNGCRSYDLGTILVEKGSVGGIVTHGAVDDPGATAVGQLVAGLLNAGFSLRSALAVAGLCHPVEGRYTVVGDGGVQIAQSENGTPNLLSVTRATDGSGYDVRISTFPAIGRAMGSCYTPYAPSFEHHYLVGGDLPSTTLSPPEVLNLLALERVPTFVDGDFHWSTDVSPDDLP